VTKNVKRNNLQPWLEYFDMLYAYEDKGLLDVFPEKHEAYITQAAVHAVSDGDDPVRQLAKAVPDTLKRIRAYAGWRSREGAGYLSRVFALHVVKDDAPHDLLYTLLLVRRRVWWRLWRLTDTVDAVTYDETKNR
jgi:hypothetical protein